MNYTELSKEISYALRHAPWEYELEMDEEGRVPIGQLISALRINPKWENVVENDIIEVVENSEKKRHEICDGKIRAFYGHSIPMKIIKEEKMPPNILYHGTAKRFMDSITKNGLLPQSRQYVHLSQDIETAENVGKRHDNNPCILVVDALRASDDGIKFYYGNEKVWLADRIPGKYIIEESNAGIAWL
jgi:putative RNA 2'-phosphotransferase